MTSTVAVVGTGEVAVAVARFLLAGDVRLTVGGSSPVRAAEVASALGAGVTSLRGPDPVLAAAASADVVVLAGGHDTTSEITRLLAAGCDVVSVAGSAFDVEARLGLDVPADRRLVVGAGFAPGLSDLLAAWSARGLAAVDSVRVAVLGSGGPACRATARAELRGRAPGWADGPIDHPAGERMGQVWFPEPFGAHRLLRAANGTGATVARALGPRHWSVGRTRLGRRGDDGVGAVRVEVEGTGPDGDVQIMVTGAVHRPAKAAGAVAGLAALACSGATEVTPPALGASVIGELTDPGRALSVLAHHGVRCAEFLGA